MSLFTAQEIEDARTSTAGASFDEYRYEHQLEKLLLTKLADVGTAPSHWAVESGNGRTFIVSYTTPILGEGDTLVPLYPSLQLAAKELQEESLLKAATELISFVDDSPEAQRPEVWSLRLGSLRKAVRSLTSPVVVSVEE